MPNSPGLSVGKVAAFVICKAGLHNQLLVFRHATAGIQIPAGTIESGETPEVAVLRELREETGLAHANLERRLTLFHERLWPSRAIVNRSTDLKKRPDDRVPDGEPRVRRGHIVRVAELHGDMTKVAIDEHNAADGHLSIDTSTGGWIPTDALFTCLDRHLFLLTSRANESGPWIIDADHGHIFTVYWMNLTDAVLVDAQQAWLTRVRPELEIR